MPSGKECERMKNIVTKFFSLESDPMLACPCGCGRADMDMEFMLTLDEIREACGFPFRVNSGFRCPTYNAQISSTGARGPHTTGKAIDIAAPSSTMRLLILSHALERGWVRFGIGKTFIHLDSLRAVEGFPSGVWSYG